MSIFNSAWQCAFETERTLAFGSIGVNYAQVGANFTQPIRILVLNNQTNVAITFSLDGVRDTITLPANTLIQLNIAANDTAQSAFVLPKNGGVWVKGAPGSGSVYVSAFYGSTGNNQ